MDNDDVDDGQIIGTDIDSDSDDYMKDREQIKKDKAEHRFKSVYYEIKDINAYFTTLFLMVGIDFASLILSGAILWFVCNINILKVYQKIQYDLWFFLACIEFSVFIEVNIYL